MTESERCEPCLTGRRDGQPCDAESCRCRCHREGKQVVEALADATLDKARAVSRTRKVGPNQWAMTVNVKELMEGKDEIIVAEVTKRDE